IRDDLVTGVQTCALPILSVIAGGVSQSVLIVDNLATNAGNSTDIYLSENLDISTPFKAWTSMDQTDQDVWYVEIVDYAATLVARSEERRVGKECSDAGCG